MRTWISKFVKSCMCQRKITHAERAVHPKGRCTSEYRQTDRQTGRRGRNGCVPRRLNCTEGRRHFAGQDTRSVGCQYLALLSAAACFHAPRHVTPCHAKYWRWMCVACALKNSTSRGTPARQSSIIFINSSAFLNHSTSPCLRRRGYDG